mmetsp:Transcript_13031/g.20223  ORF Transcript_13031/g.20223 Transcript_13031/m.20223 type:complete len:82 (+) Transcript_13031:833-1078(+)
MMLETIFLAIGFALLYFRVPDRWCKKSRFVQLYLSSSVLFSLFFINFVYETHNILYFTLKVNSNYISDEDEWWRVKNIYND